MIAMTDMKTPHAPASAEDRSISNMDITTHAMFAMRNSSHTNGDQTMTLFSGCFFILNQAVEYMKISCAHMNAVTAIF